MKGRYWPFRIALVAQQSTSDEQGCGSPVRASSGFRCDVHAHNTRRVR